MHLNGEICENMILRAKLAGNRQIDRIVMFMKNEKKMPRALSAPAPGLYTWVIQEVINANTTVL